MAAQDYLSLSKTSFPPRGTVYMGKMQSLVRESQNIILSISAVPLFDPFPDRLVIDEGKVSFIYVHFPGTETIDSVLIESISDVSVDVGIILATLRITNSSNVRFPTIMSISNLNKSDAMRARRIIQGLISIHKHGIGLSEYNLPEITSDLERLGNATEN